MAATTLEATAGRLAALLTGTAGVAGLADGGRPTGSLRFVPEVRPRRLARTGPPDDVWAVDGGQATVADARCLQVLVTRAAVVRFVGGRCVVEDEGELRVHLLGAGEERAAVESLGLGVAPDASSDGVRDLLRDGREWLAVRRCVEEADEGAMVLVDGDLLPDWRIPLAFLSELLEQAAAKGVTLAAVTKHTSLARDGAPLLGQLEREAEADLGPRAMWWAPVAEAPDRGVTVVAAKLDPDAPFAFRVDLPTGTGAEAALGALSALADDAGFPGYPYPLTVADRLAACPGWLRHEVRLQLDDELDRAGVAHDVRQRAFADRHRLMERA